MKTASYGFVAGIVFAMAALLIDIWWLTPRPIPAGGQEYGVLADIRQC